MSAHTVWQALLVTSENPLTALVAKATLAMAVALLLLGAARRSSAALRHLIAAATFGVLLLLPLAGLLVPARVIAVTPPAAPAAAETASEPATRRAAPAAIGAAVLGPARRWSRVDAGRMAWGLYLLGAAGLGLSLLAGIVRVHRLRRRADVSVSGTRLANEMAGAEGSRGGIEVAVSPELAVPVTFGWTHPVVLLPAETGEWDDRDMARAVRHELEHVKRSDWATQVVARLALALYWPHPFAWVLWRRLRLEAERACDDAVLRDGGHAEPYAEQLVSLARKLQARGEVPALSMATRSNLGLRVEAILDGGRRRGPRSRMASLAVGVAAVAAALALAPFRVMGSATPPAQDPKVADDAEGGDEADEDAEPLDMALLEAAERGNLRRMQQLLDRGARANAAIDGDGSALIAAAREGHLEAMKMLMAAGADVNLGVSGDGNALLNAAREGHLDAVRLLLERGADIDRGVVGDGNALIMAAGDGRLEVVRFLLDAGASIEKVVPGDENALIHASESGQVDVVRLLLERGANVHARVWADQGNGTGEWRTALRMALRNGHQEVARILRAAGARE
jgi:beta-lactamase regulating signal transducer with metallopeptidase domain/ankyrin repeat protein